MATEQQIAKMSAVLVEHQNEFENMTTEDRQWVIQNPKVAIGLFSNAVKNRDKDSAPEVPVKILSGVISTTAISATTEKFIAKDRFKVDTSKKAKVKISILGNNFENWFLGKIEEPFTGSMINGCQLEKSSVDGPIIAELGGEKVAETTLAEIYAMMEKQPNGEAGALLNTGWANIFYVRDINGTLRAVGVSWRGLGWDVGAYSVGNPDEWNDGHRVFSRNSLATQATQ